jgi:hypothetical protein
MVDMSRGTLSFLIGFATFFIAFVALMGFAMIRFTYYSGPIPFAPYGLPIPLLIGLTAGVITFRIKGSS